MHQYLLETIRIQPKNLASFTEWYQHQYLPELLRTTAKLNTISRYQEFGVASSLAWFTQRLITLYDFDSSVKLAEMPNLIPDIPSELSTGIVEIERYACEEIYRHPRNKQRTPFVRRPYFVVMVELDAKQNSSFCDWYHNAYLPKTLADVPTWSACRRYRSINRTPERQFTVYEADNILDLNEGFEFLRADYRYSSNADWDNWVGAAIKYQDATSFRPIFYLTKE